jgi:hypothetical protein
LCFLTNALTSAAVPAWYNLVVLYSRFPAQFFSFSPVAHPVKGESKGAVISAEDNFKNVLFFISI